MVKRIDKIYPFKARLYRQFEIEDEKDNIHKIMSATKMNEKELETAYYNEVNVNGPNGIHSDIKENWPPEFKNKSGKIFYVPTHMALNKRRNNHEITIPKIPMRFLYKKAENKDEEDEPMKNRYILFWECDAEGKFSSGNGFFYGRSTDSKPVGLGTTDSDGFLKGESLTWITDGENNSINCTRKKIFDHAEEKVLKVKKTYNNNEKDYVKDIYSSFKHRLYLGYNPLYDCGDGNFVWAQNVSRFIEDRRYAFAPLPVDIFYENSISTTDLTTIAQDYFKITVPIIGTISDFTRTFYIPDFLRSSFRVKKSLIKKLKGKKTIYDLTIENFEGYGVAEPDQEMLGQFKKDHISEHGYTLIEKKKESHDSQKIVRRIVITEKTPPIQEVKFEKYSLPEWIGRINQCIKDTKVKEDKYLEKARKYTDIIHQLNYIGNLAEIAAKFPYGDNKPVSKEAIGPLLITRDLADKIRKRFSEKVVLQEDKEFKKYHEEFEKQAKVLLNLVESKEFAKEISYYFNITIPGIPTKPSDWKHTLKFLSESGNKELKKRHYEEMASSLCETFLKAYEVIKTTDIFNVNANKETSAAWKAFENIEKAYNCMDSNEVKDNSPLGITLHFIGKKEFLFEDAFKDNFKNPFNQAAFAPAMLVQIVKIYSSYLSPPMFKSGVKNPIYQKTVEVYKNSQFIDETKAEDTINKIKEGEYSGEKNFKNIIRETREKYKKSINKSCNGIVFILNLMNMVDNYKKNKADAVKQMLCLASDTLNVYDGYLTLVNANRELIGTTFSNKGINNSIGKIINKLSNEKVLGYIGNTISAGIAMREYYTAGEDEKAMQKAVTDIGFAAAGIYFVYAFGGWLPTLVYTGLSLTLKAIIDLIIYGGPVEKTVYNLCNQLSKSEEFKLIKEDSLNYTRYNDLLEVTSEYKNSNKQLSWRAIGPLISMGFVILGKNKKKREIDFKKTEEHIKTIVKENILEMTTGQKKSIGINYKIAEGYTVKEIIEFYKNMYNFTQRIDYKDKNFMNKVMIDFNNLKNGSYDGTINGKKVQRFPYKSGSLSMKKYSLEIEDSSENVGIVEHVLDFFGQKTKTLTLDNKDESINVYDIFFDTYVFHRDGHYYRHIVLNNNKGLSESDIM